MDDKSLWDIESIKRLQRLNVLGHGSFGNVFLVCREGQDPETSEKFALKVIPSQCFKQKPYLKSYIESEIRIMKQVESQPYFVKLIYACSDAGSYFLLLEYCEGADLRFRVNRPSFRPILLQLCKQIVLGFQYLEKEKIIHRDIKPDNILLKSDGVKIADFGLSKQLYEDSCGLTQTMAGTKLTMAPEVIEGKPYTGSVDIYSLGVLFFFMIEKGYPFYEKDDKSLLKRIKEGDLSFNSEDVSDQLKIIVVQMMSYHPEDRPSLKVVEEVIDFEISQREMQMVCVSVIKSKIKSVAPEDAQEEVEEEDTVSIGNLSSLRSSFIGRTLHQQQQDNEWEFAYIPSKNYQMFLQQEIRRPTLEESQGSLIFVLPTQMQRDPEILLAIEQLKDQILRAQLLLKLTIQINSVRESVNQVLSIDKRSATDKKNKRHAVTPEEVILWTGWLSVIMFELQSSLKQLQGQLDVEAEKLRQEEQLLEERNKTRESLRDCLSQLTSSCEKAFLRSLTESQAEEKAALPSNTHAMCSLLNKFARELNVIPLRSSVIQQVLIKNLLQVWTNGDDFDLFDFDLFNMKLSGVTLHQLEPFLAKQP